MGIENQLSATRTTNMSGLNPTARVASRRYCKTALPSLFFIPLSRQAHRVTIVYLNSLLIIKEATRKLPKEWHLKSVKCVCVPICLERQESHQSQIRQEDNPAEKR